ncbi:MAG: hypothetical protein PHX21_00785 [bacterium]|nr:hypothetical protein [bacterium]
MEIDRNGRTNEQKQITMPRITTNKDNIHRRDAKFAENRKQKVFESKE